jgi:hypothetical protein
MLIAYVAQQIDPLKQKIFELEARVAKLEESPLRRLFGKREEESHDL